MRAAPLALILLLIPGGGCAGWRGTTYCAHRSPAKRASKETSYRFGEPGEGWQAVRNLKDVQVAWVDARRGAAIELHAQCDDQGDSTLHQYVDHLRIDWTRWEVQSEEQTRLVDRSALHMVVRAELDGVVRYNEFWVVKKNGCLFDLRYSANPAQFDDGRGAFTRVVEGFEFPVRGCGGG